MDDKDFLYPAIFPLYTSSCRFAGMDNSVCCRCATLRARCRCSMLRWHQELSNSRRRFRCGGEFGPNHCSVRVVVRPGSPRSLHPITPFVVVCRRMCCASFMIIPYHSVGIFTCFVVNFFLHPCARPSQMTECGKWCNVSHDPRPLTSARGSLATGFTRAFASIVGT